MGKKKYNFFQPALCHGLGIHNVESLAQALQLLGKVLIQLVWNYWNAHYANEGSYD